MPAQERIPTYFDCVPTDVLANVVRLASKVPKHKKWSRHFVVRDYPCIVDLDSPFNSMFHEIFKFLSVRSHFLMPPRPDRLRPPREWYSKEKEDTGICLCPTTQMDFFELTVASVGAAFSSLAVSDLGYITDHQRTSDVLATHCTNLRRLWITNREKQDWRCLVNSLLESVGPQLEELNLHLTHEPTMNLAVSRALNECTTLKRLRMGSKCNIPADSPVLNLLDDVSVSDVHTFYQLANVVDELTSLRTLHIDDIRCYGVHHHWPIIKDTISKLAPQLSNISLNEYMSASVCSSLIQGSPTVECRYVACRSHYDIVRMFGSRLKCLHLRTSFGDVGSKALDHCTNLEAVRINSNDYMGSLAAPRSMFRSAKPKLRRLTLDTSSAPAEQQKSLWELVASSTGMLEYLNFKSFYRVYISSMTKLVEANPNLQEVILREGDGYKKRYDEAIRYITDLVNLFNGEKMDKLCASFILYPFGMEPTSIPDTFESYPDLNEALRRSQIFIQVNNTILSG